MPVSVILFADVHYAKGLTACATRLCDRSLDKLARLAQRTKGALAYINLGDLINGRPDEQAVKSDLRAVREAISRLGAPCYSLVGNHDAAHAPRRAITGRDEDCFAFELAGLTWLALDCNFTADGRREDADTPFSWTEAALPPEQVRFLRETLAGEGGPVVILSHHPLVGDPADPHVIRNQAEVQAVIRGARRRVLALFAGHYHPGARRSLDGIPVYVLPALCEGERCPYAEVTVDGGELSVRLEDAFAALP